MNLDYLDDSYNLRRWRGRGKGRERPKGDIERR